jgi:hypothetical protein
MIKTLERVGDRLLGLVVPRTSAAAAGCWTVSNCFLCGGNRQQECWRTCCSDGWCSGWTCGSCVTFC